MNSANSNLELTQGERWFVARALAHRERTAQFNLEQQGFRSFLPKMRRTVRHARKLRDVETPLFPGYLFVILDLQRDRWRAVNGTRGIAALVMGHEQPTPVPAGVVEALIATAGQSGLVQFDLGLKIGQKIRVLSGPFAQALGRLEQLDGRGRVRVLLEIMGGEIPVHLNRSSLEPVC